MGKKTLLALFAGVFLGASGFCSSLSFQVIQHNDSLNSVCESALVIEDEILSYFFDKGFIVTNVPASVSKSDEQDKKFYQNGYNEAAGGSFDDFVQIKLYFTGDEKQNTKVALGNMKKISWKVVSVVSGKILEEGSHDVQTEVSADNEKNVRNFANEFAVHLNKVLVKR